MDNIQIFEVKLKDYRQYEGDTVISLESSKENNINVIVGQNGSGKSNILNAITLCFYGEEAHTNPQGVDSLEMDPFVTKRKLNELKPGESMEGFVEVKLGKDEPKYAFRRSFTTAKKPKSNEEGEPNFNNSVGELRLTQRFGGNDWQPISQPENVLKEILPTHVHQYFFFDGEQLDEFFGEGYSNRVKNAVLDVSHVELLNSAEEHINTVRRDYDSESSDLGGDVSKLQKRKEKAEVQLDDLKDQRKELKVELSETKSNIEGINDDLAASADEEIREMQQRREYLEGKLDEKKESLEEAKADIGTSLARAGGIAYNADALNYSIRAIQEHASSDQEYSGLNVELLESIFSKGECICGADISTDQEAKDHLKTLRDDDLSNGNDVISGRLRMENALDNGSDLVEQLIDDKSSVEDERKAILKSKEELASISTKLEDEDTIDSKRALELEEQRKRLSGRVEEMNRELGELEGGIKQQKQIIKERKREWKKALEKREENQILVEKSVFLDKASSRLEDIKTDILEKVRLQTEKRLENYYNDLIWKDEHNEITLTNDYEVRLYDQDGQKNLGSLAAGERQVLALSFMASLSKISGFSAPIVIDTPLGRISSDPKQLIAQNVPNYLDDTQVTFLMTDVEYSEDVEAFISDEVANEYNLDYHNGVTEVIDR